MLRNLKRRVAAAALSLCLTAGLLPGSAMAADSGRFSDVEKDDWFYDAVCFVSENGLMQGDGKSFDPHGILNRGMLAAMLYRAEGSPAVGNSPYPDVADWAWYAPGVVWVSDAGIAGGYPDGAFLAEAPLTRQELAVMLRRYAIFKGADVSQTAPLDGFSDSDTVPDWSREALSWAVAAGLLNGEAGALRPGGFAERAQAAAVLYRFDREIGGLTGGSQPENREEQEEMERENVEYTPAANSDRGSGFNAFDSGLLDYLSEHGYGQNSYLVSPLSLRAALALAASGAAGETRDALLKAMGFSSLEEAENWYAWLLQGVRSFQEDLDREREDYRLSPDRFSGSEPDRAYRIVNSVWHNSDKPGSFREDYIRLVKRLFDAAATEAHGTELAPRINDWVDRQTGGMIPSLVDDLRDADGVLVNALYLRTTWTNAFSEGMTRPGQFTTARGTTVEKDFMRKQSHFMYYEDENTQLVTLPMDGGMSAAFVLGDTGDIRAKLDAATYEEVIVTVPKVELETAMDDGVLADYIEAMGAGIAFAPQADFSAMCENTTWFIDDILQKSKLKMDEEGIEAAAATAIIMLAGSALIKDPPQPKVFTADRPFSIYIYSGGGEARELLFFGQYLD